MTLKQQTLGWLVELPEESPKWRELHDDLRLIRAIEEAEEAVREGRVHSPAEVRRVMEEKWARQRSK